MQETKRHFRTRISGLRSKKLLYPYLISFAALAVAAVLLLCLWFYKSVRAELYNSVCDVANEETYRMAESLENTISDLNSLSIKLNNLGEITPASFARDKYAAFRVLAHFDYVSLKYDDMVLFYPGEELLLSVGGTIYPALYFGSVPGYEALLEDIMSCHGLSFFSTMSYGAERSRAQLVCVQPLGQSLSPANPSYYALYVIKYSTLRDQLLGSRGNDTETLCALMNTQGRVLWLNSDEMFDQELLDGSSTTVNLGDRSYIHTHAAVAGKLDLVVMHVITSQFESITRLSKDLIILCVLLTLLAAGLAFVSAVKSYRPIAHIVTDLRASLQDEDTKTSTDLDMLNQLARSHSALMQERAKAPENFPDEWLQELFVLNMVQGRFTDGAALDNFRHNLKIDFTGGESFICLILLDGTFEQDKEKALRALLRDHAKEFHGCISLLLEENRILCLVNTNKADAVMRADISWRILDTLDMQGTCGTGTACVSMNDIGRSYIEAHAALDYRLIRGRNTVILFDELPEETKIRSDYPTEMLKDYVISLKSWDAETIGAQLSDILEYMHEAKLGLQSSRCLCYELTSAFFAEVRARFGNAALRIDGLDVFSISEYDSVSELMEKIRHLCDVLPRYMDRLNDGQEEQFVNDCMTIMRDNITNPQFSLEEVAEKMGVTPQTLRRRFKQQTGSTLIAAMTELRIRRAEELLTTTDMDVGTIMQQVGYLDASSFTRRFRGITGLSPTQYRHEKRHEALNGGIDQLTEK